MQPAFGPPPHGHVDSGAVRSSLGSTATRCGFHAVGPPATEAHGESLYRVSDVQFVVAVVERSMPAGL